MTSTRAPAADLELLLTYADWERTVETLQHDPGARLIGPTGVACEPRSTRVLVRRLERLGDGALSRWRDGWRDLVLVASLGDDPAARVGELVEWLRGCRRGTVLLIGTGRDAGRVSCWSVSADGVPYVVTAVKVVGTPLGWRFDAGATTTIPTAPFEPAEPVPERWSRTAGALGERVWRRVHESRVGLVGCGRSGSVVAQALALEGVGELVLVDPDVLEEGNLDAVVGVDPSAADRDRPKAELIANAVASLRPDLRVTALSFDVAHPRARRILRRLDLIIAAVDRGAPRLAMAQFCSAYLIPMLDIGTGIHHDVGGARRKGYEIRFLQPGDGCVVCAGGLRDLAGARRELITSRSAARDEHARPGRPNSGDWRGERAGSLLAVNMMAVGHALELWHAALAGDLRRSRWIRREWDETGATSEDDLELRAGEDCAICRAAGVGDGRYG